MIISSSSSSFLIINFINSKVCSISGIFDLYTFFERSKLVSMYLYLEYNSLKAPNAVSTETSPRNSSTSSMKVEAGIPRGFFPSVMSDCKLKSFAVWAIFIVLDRQASFQMLELLRLGQIARKSKIEAK